MAWYELMDDGNSTVAVGPFIDSNAGADWAISQEEYTVTSRGGVETISRREWNRRRKASK